MYGAKISTSIWDIFENLNSYPGGWLILGLILLGVLVPIIVFLVFLARMRKGKFGDSKKAKTPSEISIREEVARYVDVNDFNGLSMHFDKIEDTGDLREAVKFALMRATGNLNLKMVDRITKWVNEKTGSKD